MQKSNNNRLCSCSFYNEHIHILRKEYTQQERRLILLNLCQILTVVGITKDNIENVLKNEEFTDMEDCLQMECAINF